jgi:DNA-binding response OmpR family regulator
VLAGNELQTSQPVQTAGVLVISEDQASRDLLAKALEAEGYRVSFAAPASGGLISGAELDLAVVDLSCESDRPERIIGELRAHTDLPIMAVTAVTIAEATVLNAYAAGADQCVNGFARPRELLARVRALLRRGARSTPGATSAGATVPAGFSVDAARRIALVSGVEIALTPIECEILDSLIRRPGRVVRRDELVGPEVSASALDSHVRRLRDKVEAVDDRRRIVVVRGVGFRFDAS